MKIKKSVVTPPQAERMGFHISKRLKEEITKGEAELELTRTDINIEEMTILMLIRAGCNVKTITTFEEYKDAIRKYLLNT